MGTRQLYRLSARTVAAVTTPGLHCDGGGLYLQVAARGTKAWIFRFRSPATGRTRDMGLGPLHAVSLAEARDKAAALRSSVADGTDPIEAKITARRQREAEAANAATFADCARQYIDSHRAAWTNPKHAEQWTSTLETYASPVFGSLPAQAVDTALVLRVLSPIWTTKHETATRLRARIENVLDWAKVRGYRTGDNPARWKGHLNQLLPTIAKRQRVQHFAAMPFGELATFMARLREQSGAAARCMEFAILTAARTCEAIGACRDEFDLDNATWTIPAGRMKAKREHRVPLSPRAVAIIRGQWSDDSAHLFRTPGSAKPLSNGAMLALLERMGLDVTVHGFRSSFRDWAAERTAFAHEVCEMALAHTIPNAAEAAYRRGDLFDKRRQLMQAWADFCDHPAEANPGA